MKYLMVTKKDPVRIFTLKQKISNIILSGFVKGPAYFFLLLITGFVLFAITESLYAFLIAIPLVIIIHIYRANKEINNYEKAFNEHIQAALNSQDKVDYYDAGVHDAISLNVAEKQFCLVFFVSFKKPPRTIKLSFNKIKSFTAVTPDYTTTNANGYINTVDNMRSVGQAVLSTGLYIEYDELDVMRYFLQMPYAHAERWVRVFEKLNDGTLEQKPNPTCLADIHNTQ